MHCTKCGREVKETMKFCPGCGNPLKAAVPEVPKETEEKKPVKVSAPAEETEAHIEAKKTAKGGKILLGVLVALLLVVIGLGVAALLTLNHGVDQTENTEDSAQTQIHAESAVPTEQSELGAEASQEVSLEAGMEPSPEPSPEILKTDFASLVQGLQGRTNISLVTTDASEYPYMKLYVSLEDASGSGDSIILQSPTAGIMESISGGATVERTIRSVERLEGNVGIGLDIVVDESGSMSSNMSKMQNILQEFIESLDYAAGDKGEIIGFNSDIFTLCGYTDNESNLLNGISNLYARGETALYDALYQGVSNAAYRSGANCVIGFTDGLDNQSSYTYQQVITYAQEKAIPLYLIGLGDVDESELRTMAEQTGGKYWSIDAIGSMDEVLQQIYQVQKDMYCITYESDANAAADADRVISCVLEEADGSLGGLAESVSFQAVDKQSQQHTSRYEIVQADVSWTEAYNAAVAAGGHLATITSQTEMDALTDMAEAKGLSYLWLGGYTTDQNNKDSVIWITGEPFDYEQWFPGEPSIWDKDGTAEYFMMLWYVNDYWSWNDQRNDVLSAQNYFTGKLGYIIEYDDIT